MKRSSLPKLGSVLLGIIAVIILMGFVNHQSAAAASLQNHAQSVDRLMMSEPGVWTWEISASHNISHQDLTGFNAADISAYRWNAMAQYYAAHQDLTTFNVGDTLVYRLMMSKPGMWTREASAH